MPCTLVIAHLRVTSLDIDLLTVDWETEPSYESVLDYTFTVLRSEGPEGPYDLLSPAMDDQYTYADMTVNLKHFYRQYFYKVRVTHKASGDHKDYGPASNEAEPDLVARELRSHMGLLMREFAGRRCWLLPRRTWGQRCSCFDVNLQKRTRSGCATCFDTSFVRGYMSPVEVWAQFDPSPQTEQQSALGVMQQDNTTVRLPYYPPVKPGDVLVEAENVRWRIGKVSGTEQGRAKVHQELQVHRIPRSDMEYRVPLELERALKDLWINPSRNYTNPQTVEEAEDAEFANVLGIYPSY
jgi:hypothetical protein